MCFTLGSAQHHMLFLEAKNTHVVTILEQKSHPTVNSTNVRYISTFTYTSKPMKPKITMKVIHILSAQHENIPTFLYHSLN